MEQLSGGGDRARCFGDDRSIRTSVTHPILVRKKARAVYSQESVDHSHAQIQWSFKGLLKSVYFKTGMCLPEVTTGSVKT